MTCNNDNIRVSVIIDIAKTTLSLYEMLSRIDQMKASPRYRNSEFYLDSGRNAIMIKEVLA